MNHLVSLIGDPYLWGLIFAYWIFSAAVGALEKPTDKSGAFYKWMFQFLNTLAGNITRAFGSKIPGNQPPSAA